MNLLNFKNVHANRFPWGATIDWLPDQNFHNLAFFGLELFVGVIQALVFALLTLIFMNSATEHHGSGEEHH